MRQRRRKELRAGQKARLSSTCGYSDEWWLPMPTV